MEHIKRLMMQIIMIETLMTSKIVIYFLESKEIELKAKKLEKRGQELHILKGT